MKNKNVFMVAIFSLVIFIGIATYLWYLYFHDNEERLIAENCKTDFSREVELVNTGNVNYVDAGTDDSDSSIPVYYFSVKNKSNQDFGYSIVLEEKDGNDGCTNDTRLNLNELEYELKMDNKLVKQGGLETIQNGVLDTNIIKSNAANDYSLIIKLKSDIGDYEQKHFHYVVNIKEQK